MGALASLGVPASALALGIALFFGLLVLGAEPALAQGEDGLVVSSDTTYTPSPENSEVVVTSIYTFTNVKPTVYYDTYYEQYWFDTWGIGIPQNATDFAAFSGYSLNVWTEESDSDELKFGLFSFPYNLYYQQTLTVEVSYRIPSGEPRDQTAFARSNPSYLAFPVWACCDPGLADVRIAVPDGFAMDFEGAMDGLELVEIDGQAFYEANQIAEPEEFFGFVFGRNDSGLVSQEVELSGGTATVSSWPDDPIWADFVVTSLEQDVPILENLIGLPWPAGDIEIIETVTPYLYGYAGWFNGADGLIEVGEDLNREVIIHEFTHAWFNEDLVFGRWITEGLAEEFASRTIEASGDELPNPDEPDLDDPVREQLVRWSQPFFMSDEELATYEGYHYNSSWWVMRQLSEEVGIEGLAAVLQAMDNDEISFVGEGAPETWAGLDTWKRFFDLVELRAGSEEVGDLFRLYVLEDRDVSLLDDRAESLALYEDFVVETGEWSPPIGLRRSLTAWRFRSFGNELEEAQAVLAVRDQIDTLASSLGVTVVHRAEELYEEAEDARTLGDVLVVAQDQLAGLEEVAAARAQVEAEAASMGLDNPSWPVADGETDLAAELDLVDDRLDTMATVAAAEEVVASERTFAQRIGLWREDPGRPILAARAAFEADDRDASLAAAAEAEELIAGAAAIGRTRITWTSIAAGLVFVLLLLTTVLLVRRRRRRRASEAGEEAEEGRGEAEGDPESAVGGDADPFQSDAAGASSGWSVAEYLAAEDEREAADAADDPKGRPSSGSQDEPAEDLIF